MKLRVLAVATLPLSLLMACSTQGTSPDAERGPADDLWVQANEVKPDKPWIVGLGDSYSSGEGGRWATNGYDNALIGTNGGWLVGSVEQVYGDGDGQESAPFCHRTATAPMFANADYNVKNLACSGAMTNSYFKSYGRVAPGIDFVDEETELGRMRGQALQLQEFAEGKEIDAVTLGISGNDVGFSEILGECFVTFLKPVGDERCKDSQQSKKLINDVVKVEVTEDIAKAVKNVNTAMKKAGHKPDSWRLIFLQYPSPVPSSDKIEYDEGYDRQTDGGCGLFNEDLDWANSTVLPFVNGLIRDGAALANKKHTNLAPTTVLNVNPAYDGHRVCETGTERPEPAGTGLPPSSVGETAEWFRFASVEVAELDPEAHDGIEPMHPNYFGQRVGASCVHEALEYTGPASELNCTRAGDPEFDDQMPPFLTNVSVAPSGSTDSSASPSASPASSPASPTSSN